MLSKIGYRFGVDELEDWEVESFNLIASTFAKEDELEMKRKTSRKK